MHCFINPLSIRIIEYRIIFHAGLGLQMEVDLVFEQNVD